eukprot:1028423-Pelagomonas_calceolata.AAC.4
MGQKVWNQEHYEHFCACSQMRNMVLPSMRQPAKHGKRGCGRVRYCTGEDGLASSSGARQGKRKENRIAP